MKKEAVKAVILNHFLYVDGNMFYIVTSVYNEESVFHRLDISEPSTVTLTLYLVQKDRAAIDLI